jgi:NAD(P)-dependent dehydrogenase (short-subunit alcohol dehydrogenase family)
MDLKNKIAIITGGGKGIGQGISTRFAEEGAEVVIAQRSKVSAESTAENISTAGGSVLVIPTDLAEPASIEAMVKKVINEFGRIDILVNNAARAGGNGPFLEISLESWQRVIDVNLTGLFYCSQLVARHMVEQKNCGRIINIGSLDSFIAEKNASAYAASKGGVLMLTKAMAVDLAAYGILVNCIAPGSIRVERNAPYYDKEPLRTALAKGIPLGHTGLPEDIAAAAVFLASDDSKFINGTSLVVDGGFTAYLRAD